MPAQAFLCIYQHHIAFALFIAQSAQWHHPPFFLWFGAFFKTNFYSSCVECCISAFNLLLGLPEQLRSELRGAGTLWAWGAGGSALGSGQWVNSTSSTPDLGSAAALQGFLNYIVNFHLCLLPVLTPKFNIFIPNSYQNTAASERETFTCVIKSNNIPKAEARNAPD